MARPAARRQTDQGSQSKLTPYRVGQDFPMVKPTTHRHTRKNNMKAEVTQKGALDMQVCIPAEWTDRQITDFANENNPCGTMNGWFIRRLGDEALSGAPERNPCAERPDFVHVMLDA